MIEKRSPSPRSSALGRLGEIIISPRWRKVFSDLWSNKVRTVLVILSIAVGVFAVGFVSGTFTLILEDMDRDYKSANAHSAIIFCDEFSDDLLVTVRGVKGVQDAEGRSTINARIFSGGGNKIPIQISGLPPLKDMNIDLLKPIVPGEKLQLNDKEILIEKSVLQTLPVKAGDVVQVELDDGKTREMIVAGAVHDVSGIPYLFTGTAGGYVNQTTMEWLGGPKNFNAMYLTVSEDKTSQPHVEDVTKEITRKIEKSGVHVYTNFIYQPGRHFASDITQTLGATMGILGALSVFLSTFLVVNTISALLSQQIRQIGMMKAVGGRTSQMVQMYLVLVGMFGMLAFLIAMPLSALIGYRIAGGFASYLNFQLYEFRVPIQAVLQEFFVALVIPIAAALVPILQGTRLTIREALNNYGLGTGKFGKNWLDRLLGKIKGLSRPLLISLRNTFRRKGRLFLTLSTLTLAGAIFIGVFNLKAALNITISETFGYFLSDVVVAFNRTYRYEQLEPVLYSIPNVSGAEAWGGAEVELLSVDKKTTTPLTIIAPPSKSTLIKAAMTGGRWLVPGDENALVIGNHLLKVRPDLKVGDTVTLKINDKEYNWKIVGTFKMAGNTNRPPVYTNYEYLAKITNKSVGEINNLRVVTSPHDDFTQERVAKALEVALKQKGFGVAQIITGSQVRAQNASVTDILVYFLLVMAVLIAMVGGLGMSGTMSMNTLERTREIGVMRAIGGSDSQIAMLVLVEGMLIGVISWILGSIFALPISYLLDVVVGLSFVQSPLNFVFSLDGFIIWFIGALVISAVASYLPARNASRLTVREVLAYE